jgi:very-short-patch-repair endonuclease
MVIRTVGEIVTELYADEAGLRRRWRRNRLAQRVMEAGERGERLNAIKRFYEDVRTDLLKSPAHQWAHGPYMLDWLKLFTPIECALWEEIRDIGAVFYPQYPVGRYFVDFGNPVARVAIECDGKEFHQDRAADSLRQAEIEAQGWVVYRITGRDCMISADEVLDDDGTLLRYESPSSRFVTDIAMRHALASRYLVREEV